MVDPLTPAADLPKTCLYRCDGSYYNLVGGFAPPGFYCGEVLGSCSTAGEELLASPVPQPFPSLFALPNVGIYHVDSAGEVLYFNSGSADDGFRFYPSLTLEELRDQFPTIAAEVELLKNTRFIASLRVRIPAVPIAGD